MWRRLRLSLGLGTVFALPGLAVLAVLAWAGWLAAAPALAAGALLLLLTWLVAAPHMTALTALAETADRLGADVAPGPGPMPPRHRLGTQFLWLSLHRLARAWRERLRRAEAGQAAAEAVIAAMPDPVVLLDDKRRIVRANLRSREFIGATAKDAPDLAARFRHPALLAAADAVLRGAPEQVVDFHAGYSVERVLRARICRLDGPAADGAAAILTLHDITELKRAEQLRGDFIANASHELKTPLATLVGFIETLQGPARGDAEARDRFLGIMREQALRMTRLVDDLLSLSRIELNEHVPPTERVALAPLLRHVVDTLELRAQERNVRVVLALPPDLPDVRGERDELAQVFQNLLDNAIKYGRDGTEARVEAGVSGAAAAGAVWVRVRDQGDGIASAHLPRLTERFYRVDTARSRALGGTGLGLAIVKHIVNRHRGTLSIESTLGVGSAFTVRLPAAEG
ncbi:MAG TPA: ATP-binding protein [Stellaceae bacterium]|nr:ATP-binding protein [Stellaceae bacterium]